MLTLLRRDMPWRLASIVIVLGAHIGVAHACGRSDTPFSAAWRSMLACAHPLCGTGLWVTRPADDPVCDIDLHVVAHVVRTLDAGGFVLLGEVHDNPVHHRLRAELITQIRSRVRPAVVFEQMRADQQSALDSLNTEAGGRKDSVLAQDVFDRLDWARSGWPSADIYRPLIESVLTRRLPILPGDPPRGRTREIARGGIAAIGEDERQRLSLDRPMPQPLGDALAKELAGSHCGMLPERAVPGMALAQRYRDAHLADALISAQTAHGAAILIAGNGHVRRDRGVPFALSLRAPDAKVVALTLVEVQDGQTDPDTYVPRGPDGLPATDFVIFTLRAERGDPCAGMRAKPAAKP